MDAEIYFEKIKNIFNNENAGYDISKIKLEYRTPAKTSAYYAITMFDKPCINFKGKQKEYMYVVPSLYNIFKSCDENFEYVKSLRQGRIQITPMTDMSIYKTAFLETYEKCLQDIGFDCCSHYLECSDAKQCIKTDIMFAGQCRYRQIMKQGKIFYGKNRNI